MGPLGSFSLLYPKDKKKRGSRLLFYPEREREEGWIRLRLIQTSVLTPPATMLALSTPWVRRKKMDQYLFLFYIPFFFMLKIKDKREGEENI